MIAVKTSACVYVNSDKRTSRFVVFEGNKVVELLKLKLLMANSRLNNLAAYQLDSTFFSIRTISLCELPKFLLT